MTPIPTPPTAPEDLAAFEAHVRENPQSWADHYQQAQACMESQRLQIDHLGQELSDARAREKGLLLQLKDKDAQIIEVSVTARMAQQASLPTVSVPTPVTSGVQPPEPPIDIYVGTPPPPVAGSATSTRLSEKLPDPEKFNGSRPDLRRFAQQVQAKITANLDRFPTPANRLIYVAGRLSDRAYDLILPKIINGVPQFPDYPDLLDYLDKAFGDPDRKQRAVDELFRLRQKNKDFSSFFAEFQRLALEGEMEESALPPLLSQSISRELHDMLLNNEPASLEYHKYAEHLQRLENRLAFHRHQTAQRGPRPGISHTQQPTRRTTSPPRGRSPPRAPALAPANRGEPMDLSHQQRLDHTNSRKDNHECFRCGSQNHYVKDCKEPDNRPIKFRSGGLGSPRKPRSTGSRESNRSPRSPQSRASRTPSSEYISGISGNGTRLS